MISDMYRFKIETLKKDRDSLFYVDIDWCIAQTEKKEMLFNKKFVSKNFI